MTWIKICGTTNLEDAQLAAEAGADALGFIFAPSARRVAPDTAAAIIRELPKSVLKVGVFVNETAEKIAEIARETGLTGAQLHGDETLHSVQAIEGILGGDFAVLKAISAEVVEDGGRVHEAMARPDRAFLLDNTALGARGGTGEAFEWADAAPQVRRMSARFNFIIAGGLTPENVGEAIHLFRPWGVDVVSGVESRPGKKDREKLCAFIRAVRQADTAVSLKGPG